MLGALPAANAANLTGLQFFPRLISGPFHDGLVIVFWLAIAMSMVGALASLARSRRGTPGDFVGHEAEVKEEFEPAQPLSPATPVAEPLDDSPVRA